MLNSKISRYIKVNKIFSSRFQSTTILREEKIKIGNYNINYVKVGTGTHTVLCLPGIFGTIWTDFKPQIESFDRNKFTLVAWDAPGFGKSRPPEKEYSINVYERDADYAYNFMKALKFDTYSVLGWSAGGITAAIHAAKYPDAMRKFVVWGSNCVILPQDIENYKKMRNMANWSKSSLLTMIQVYGKDFEKYYFKWTEAMLAIYKENNGNLCLEFLPNIKCPTFIFYGNNDPIVDKGHFLYFNSNIMGSRTFVYPYGKHNIHLKYAEDFNKRVQEFLLE